MKTRLVSPDGTRGCYKSQGVWIPMCWARLHNENDCSCYRELVPKLEDEHDREASRILWAFKEATGPEAHIERAKIAEHIAGLLRNPTP